MTTQRKPYDSDVSDAERGTNGFGTNELTPFVSRTDRIYGHGPKNPHGGFKHINVKLPDGTKVTIGIEPK